MKAAHLALVTPLLMGGCFNRAEVPYLGRWTGKFAVQTVDRKLAIDSPMRNSFRAELQLYRTLNRCDMKLEGEQEGIDVAGSWKLHGRQIVLSFNKMVSIDDAGGIDLRDPNRAFIPVSDLKSAASRPLALSIGGRGKTLISPPVQMGPLLGHYEFAKESIGR